MALWTYQHPSSVSSVAISHDGTMLASGSSLASECFGGKVQICDTNARTVINEVKGSTSFLLFAPDNTLITVSGEYYD